MNALLEAQPAGLIVSKTVMERDRPANLHGHLRPEINLINGNWGRPAGFEGSPADVVTVSL
jgi:hypothetical protein